MSMMTESTRNHQLQDPDPSVLRGRYTGPVAESFVLGLCDHIESLRWAGELMKGCVRK